MTRAQKRVQTRILPAQAACALLLLSLAGGPLPAQSVASLPDTAKPAGSATQPASPTDRRLADLETRLATLEQEALALHQEISALKAESQQTDPPENAALVLASSVRALTANLPANALPASTVSLSMEPASGANALGSAGVPEWLTPMMGATPVGLLNVYYSYNAHQPISGLSSLRLFDDQTNQLALGLLELGMTKQPIPASRFGFTLTAGFGDDINAVNSNDPGGLAFAQYLHEGYASYLIPAGHGLDTDVGKFDLAIGAESMESPANWNYSRSVLYNYAIPFYGFGVRSRYNFNGKYALTGYLVNGWDNLVDTYSSGKTKGLEGAWYPTGRFSLTEAWLTGRGATDDTQEKTVSDSVARFDVTAKLSLMADGVYGRSEQENPSELHFFWTGAAGYLQYRFDPRWAAASRFEYYDDHNGITTCGACATPTPQDLKEVTATGERNVDRHLLGRLEYRYDMSNRPVFYRAATPIKDQMTITMGLVYMLQPIDQKQ